MYCLLCDMHFFLSCRCTLSILVEVQSDECIEVGSNSTLLHQNMFIIPCFGIQIVTMQVH